MKDSDFNDITKTQDIVIDVTNLTFYTAATCCTKLQCREEGCCYPDCAKGFYVSKSPEDFVNKLQELTKTGKTISLVNKF